MKKPEQLRKIIEKAVPIFKNNPDRLQLFIDNGQIISTNANNLSYEIRYTLNVIITDYSEDIATLIIPILYFLKKNQSELLANPAKREDAIKFISDINNHTSQDISLEIKLTERVAVKEDDKNKLTVKYKPEPNWDDFDKTRLIIDKKTTG